MTGLDFFIKMTKGLMIIFKAVLVMAVVNFGFIDSSTCH